MVVAGKSKAGARFSRRRSSQPTRNTSVSPAQAAQTSDLNQGLDAADRRLLDGRRHDALRVHGEECVRPGGSSARPSPMILKLFTNVSEMPPIALTSLFQASHRWREGRTARQPHARDPLGVEVESDLDVAAPTLGEPELGEQCAAQMDRLPARLFGGEDGVEWDFRCRFSRSRRGRNQAGRTTASKMIRRRSMISPFRSLVAGVSNPPERVKPGSRARRLTPSPTPLIWSNADRWMRESSPPGPSWVPALEVRSGLSRRSRPCSCSGRRRQRRSGNASSSRANTSADS